MSYGGHLRTLRGEAGLSRAELARRARVPVGTLRNWENDRGFPGRRRRATHAPACLLQRHPLLAQADDFLLAGEVA